MSFASETSSVELAASALELATKDKNTIAKIRARRNFIKIL